MQTKSLALFKAQALNRKDDTTIFLTNTINSNFISLEHTYNNDDEGAFITLEFIDPSYSLEDGMSFDLDMGVINSVNGLDITNTVTDLLQRIANADPEDPMNKTQTLQDYRIKNARELGEEIHRQEGVIAAYETQLGLHVEQYDSQYGSREELWGKLNKAQAKYEKLLAGSTLGGWQMESLARDQVTGDRLRNEKKVESVTTKNEDGIAELDQGKVNEINLKLRKLAVREGLQKGVFDKPVYIAYGMGDDLRRNWCAPQCFGKPVRAEYSFAGDGARVIKLIFGGKAGIGSVLGQIGVGALGKDALGKDASPVIYTGMSDLLFDGAFTHSQMNKFDKILKQKRRSKLVASVLAGMEGWVAPITSWQATTEAFYPIIPGMDVQDFGWAPSIHMAFKKCMTNFLETAVGGKYKGNVIVLFPNIDAALNSAWVTCYNESWGAGKMELDPGAAPQNIYDSPQRAQHRPALFGAGFTTHLLDPSKGIDAKIPAEFGGGTEFGPRWFNAFGKLAESLGLQLVDSASHFPGVIDPLWRSRLAMFGDEWTLARWFGAMLPRISCHNYGFTPFIDKLDDVGGALQTKFSEGGEKVPPITPTLMIETDQIILTALKNAGAIENDAYPAVIWGDPKLKQKYVEARVVENQEVESLEEGVKAALDNSGDLHLIDRLVFDETYLTEVAEHLNPAAHGGGMSWMGMNPAREEMFRNDKNMMKSYEPFSKSTPLSDRIPVFAFGIADPNVLKVKMDLDNQYSNLLKAGAGLKTANALVTTNYLFAKSSTGDKEELVDYLLKVGEWKVERENSETGEIPEGFKKLVKSYFVYQPFDAGITTGYGAMQMTHGGNPEKTTTDFGKLTNVLSQASLLKQLRSDLKDNKGNEDNYYALMWAAFLRIYEQTKTALPFNTGIRKLGGKNTFSQNMKINISATERFLAMALVGRVEVLPMFNLSSERTAMSRRCILYGREPRFSHITYNKETFKSAWFSGVYKIHGWRHYIGEGSATSEFYIHRNTTAINASEATQGIK